MLNLYEKYHSKRVHLHWIIQGNQEKIQSHENFVSWMLCTHYALLISPDVVYVDSFRNMQKFYESSQVKEFIEKNKEYSEKTNLKFHHQDYCKDLP